LWEDFSNDDKIYYESLAESFRDSVEAHLQGLVDCDKDGHFLDTDCDDSDFTINSSAEEICNDVLDNNCNTQIDEDCYVSDRYKLIGDGITLDNETDLMWMQYDVEPMDWYKARSYCKYNEIDGYRNWRLPTKNELMGLVDTSYFPTIDPIFECSPIQYWTISEVPPISTYRWYVNFYSGSASYFFWWQKMPFRCVRGHQ
jgi:hypothetical protein